MFPPRVVFQDARERHHASNASWKCGVMTYDGVEYEVASDIDLEGFGLTADGSAAELTQRLVVHVLKSLMAARGVTRPKRGEFVQIAGLGFTVEDVGGDNEHDVHWELVCRRTPGQDES